VQLCFFPHPTDVAAADVPDHVGVEVAELEGQELEVVELEGQEVVGMEGGGQVNQLAEDTPQRLQEQELVV
jgi:hypothetical protein